MVNSMSKHESSANGLATTGGMRRGDKKRPRTFANWILKYQIAVSSLFTTGAIVLHALSPESRHYTQKLLQLSYPSSSGTYTQGIDDFYFVFFWTVMFTALRAITIEWLMQPLASFLKVDKKYHLRFAEQGWLIVYYGIFWTLGVHLWYNSPYWLNNAEIWTAWPAREMSWTFKWYYLVQLAFWIQQILVIHIEARRKDHVQMLTHHIVTCILITATYVYRYTRAANVVLCLMDAVDLVLPIAKILRYLRYEAACNVAFVVFVVTWLITRHLMYLKLCYDIYVDVPGSSTMLFGCYNGATSQRIPDMPAQPDNFSHLLWPFLNLDGVICLNTEVKYIFLGMLLILQTLCLIWFGMIVKVITGIVTGGNAEDTRSDSEEAKEEEIEGEKLRSIQRPLNVTDLNVCVGGGSELPAKSVLSPRPRQRATTGRRRLMDADNRKELLARIGCEKPI